MRLNNTRELGAFVRAERRRRGMTQTQLCGEARVSRRWLSDLEAGKATAEIGLVFQVLYAMNLRLDASPHVPNPNDIDLDEVLASYARRGREADGVLRF